VKLLQVFPFLDASTEQWATEARLIRWLTFLWLFAGLAILFSASYPTADSNFGDGLYYFKSQLIWVALGLVLFHVVANLSLRRMLKVASIGLFFVLALLFATHIPGIGETRNDSTRWLAVGSFLVQPSELIKPFLVLQAAYLFGHWQRLSLLSRLGWLAVFAMALAGILLQPSLSMTALCGITLWLIALAAGLPIGQLAGTTILGMTAATVSVMFKDYQRRRLISFLNPWADAAGDGYQLSQSLMAVGSGGFWGTGFGLSRQKQFLPEQYTDFIFAIFAEEFGLIGGILLILMLVVFLTLGLRVALKSKDSIARLVAIGATVLLVGQSFLNIGVATGALPTTGLPFPFISYGGSSMMSSLFVAGLLVRAAREMSIADVIPLNKTSENPQDADPRKQEKVTAKRRRPYSIK